MCVIVFSELVYLTTTAEELGGTPLAVQSLGSGMAQVDFDPAIMLLTWDITFESLSSLTTQAHFHGPANTTQVAPVEVCFACEFLLLDFAVCVVLIGFMHAGLFLLMSDGEYAYY